MSYRVEYGPVKKVRNVEKRTVRLPALTAAAALVFLLMVTFFWSEGAAVLREVLIPGDSVVTAAAFEDMSSALRSGETVRESLRIFCLRVLEGAGVGPD